MQAIYLNSETMKLFSPLYTHAMAWSRHPRAPWYLGTHSFAESSFFPVPPDVMQAPMCLEFRAADNLDFRRGWHVWLCHRLFRH